MLNILKVRKFAFFVHDVNYKLLLSREHNWKDYQYHEQI